MRYSFSLETGTEPEGDDPEAVSVGWLLKDPRAGVIFAPPRRLAPAARPGGPGALAAGRAAAHDLERRLHVVDCPYDLQLILKPGPDGQIVLNNMLGEASPVRTSLLKQLLKVTPRAEWRHGDRPILQLQLPYVFVADEPVVLSQLPPFLSPPTEPWPGVQFCGRFPIHIWPRPLAWSFEWHDIGRPLRLRRGAPLFYVQFETLPQHRPIRLVRATRTPDLMDYLDHVAGAVNFVDQTLSLFERALEERPERLLVPKGR